MKNLQKILKQITNLTLKIEVEYPELYCFLNEDILTIPSKNHPKINIKVMQNYLETLQQMLKEYIKTHEKK